MTNKPHLIAVAIALCLAVPPDSPAAEVVVVCPGQFQETFQPWLDHRRGEGMTVTVIPSANDADALRRAIRTASADNTRYVVLVGDAPVIGTPCNETCEVPILYRRTKVTAAWGSTPTLSSDLLYGDFDSDDIPDAVVGRLPVDDTEQLQQLISRIVQYEQCQDFGHWRSRVQLVGGVGGFGVLADAAIESVTRTVVTSVLPSETRTRVAYASSGHLFCPTKNSLDGGTFTDAVLKNYSKGSRFWVYAGHGQVTELDRVPQTATGVPVLDRRSVQQLDRPSGCSPIAVLLACYTGALDASEDSIAEEMLLCAGGPIAVIAGSRVTMPYGNTTAAVGLIDGVFSRGLPRLGDAWLSALGDMHRQTSDDTSTVRRMIDGLAAVISPAGSNLAEERREHMLLYNLIGDPTLQMNHPHPIAINVLPSHAAGQAVTITVNCPMNGELTVSLDRPLGAITEGDPNDTTIASIVSQAVAGQQRRPSIVVPGNVHGPIIVRAFIAGENAWASGAAQTIMLAQP